MNARMIRASSAATLAVSMLVATSNVSAQGEDDAFTGIDFDSTPEYQDLQETLNNHWETCTTNPTGAGCSPPSPPPVGGASGAYTSCFPTCTNNDSRMLALAGSGLATLAGDAIRLGIGSPA
jgi:hypothetical protein